MFRLFYASNIIMKILHNTYRRGTLTFISYPVKEGQVAACEELCLLVEEKDAELAKLKILAKAKSYLENVIKEKLGKHLLNQSLPKEIKAEFKKYIHSRTNQVERWTQSIAGVMNDNCICA